MSRSALPRAGALRRLGLLAAVFACTAGTPAVAHAFSISATFDTSITNHPQSAVIMSTINAAIAQYPARIPDAVTVNITFRRMYSGLGGSSSFSYKVLYTDVLAAMRDHAASFDDAVALTHLPDGLPNPVNGNDSVWVKKPLYRALGLGTGPQPEPFVAVTILNPERGDPQAAPAVRERVRRMVLAEATTPEAVQAGSDGTISLYLDLMNLTTNPTPPGKYSLFSVTSHEIDEVIGSASALNGLNNGAPAPTGPVQAEDLFRYDDSGGRSFHTSNTTDSSFFSLDGARLLVRFNQSQNGDFSDWWSPGGQIPRVQDAFATPGTDPAMGVEWRMLDALGWNYAPSGTWVDLGYGGVQTGNYDTPFTVLATGIAATPGGAMTFIKAGTNDASPQTLSAPARLTAVGGAVTFGH